MLCRFNALQMRLNCSETLGYGKLPLGAAARVEQGPPLQKAPSRCS
jgi:hypothetical protein